MTAAYWISPKGQLVDVETSHIEAVINYPSKFGLSKTEIQRRYKEHKEKIPIEGQAREEIICELISNNWIRLRRYTNKYWSITVKKLDHKKKALLHQWASRILKTGIKGLKEEDKYMPVRIVLLEKQETLDDLTVSYIASKRWIENAEYKKHPLVIKTCFNELPDL